MKQDVNVIFLDNHLLVLNKPSGLLTQPSGLAEISLEEMGKNFLKEHFKKPGNVFLEAIHRIDRSASGLVLFARTSKALSRLKHALRENQFRKEYFALVEGTLKNKEAELTHYLTHDEFCAKVYDAPTENAKLCRLRYSVIKKEKGYSLLRVFLYTGRYHQIRAQLSAIGHPIVGDKKYGSTQPAHTIALHHCQLQVPHPISLEECVWKAPLFDTWPDSFHIIS